MCESSIQYCALLHSMQCLACLVMQSSLHPVLAPFLCIWRCEPLSCWRYRCSVKDTRQVVLRPKCVPSDHPVIHAACLQVPYLFSIALRLQCITSQCIQGNIAQPCMWLVLQLHAHTEWCVCVQCHSSKCTAQPGSSSQVHFPNLS